jgi:quinoprotein glucose dehydrogenase
VDLRAGLGRDPETLSVSLNSPGVIYRDLLIVGSTVSEDLPSAPGDIRAYDARTGKIRWTFHTIPRPGEYGYDTWPKDAWKWTGGANAWAGLAVDERRGLVFAPTGSAAFDFYGANRAGDNLFANCLITLKADTGERVWHFQGVRHDVWDRDFPSAPRLVTVRRDGRMVDAVAQTTKSGFVYLFERETGKPLFPIEYRKVPVDGVDGEVLAGAQPLPTLPPPFARQRFTEDLARTPEILERLRGYRNGGQFEPPSREGTIVFPGFDGGAEWGGPAFDEQTGMLYVNANEMAWVLRLIDRPKTGLRTTSRALYLQHCASCHGKEREGAGEFPALRNRFGEAQVAAVVRKGTGRMPSFAGLPAPTVKAIARYAATGVDGPAEGGKAPWPELKYTLDKYTKFLDADGYPAVKPPWGTLSAIDLNRGTIAWQVPLGEYPELAAKGMRNTGSENYGGPVLSKRGLLFIGATNYDRKFRAFDPRNGKLLWETTLPAAGNATPVVYEADGHEYVAIAAGGGKWGAPSGGSYVAFRVE